MNQDSITARAAKGAAWLLLWRFFTRSIGLLSMLILARLLTPADFGIISLGMAMVAALGAFSYLGIAEQLVRVEDPDKSFYDTAFTITVIRNTLMALILLVGSRQIAMFFGDQSLIPVVRASAAMVFIEGLQNIWVVEYRRNIDFSKDVQLSAVTRVISSSVTIGTAFLFRDYRALIAGILTGYGISTAYSYFIHPKRPSFSLRRWHEMTSFSAWSWANGIVNTIRNKLDSFIIARALGPTPLGIYSVATEVATLPFSEFLWPLSGVLFSGFAAIQNSGSRIDLAYARALGIAFLLVLPATLGTAFVARPAIALMFGKAWMEAVPLVQILALSGSLAVASMIGRALLSSAGLPRITFQIALIALVIRVPVIVVLTLRYGLFGAAAGVLIGTALEEVQFLVVTMRRCKVRLPTILAQVWRPAAASAVMAAALAGSAGWWSPESHVKVELLRSLGIAIPGGATIYAATLLGLWLLSGRPQSAERELVEHGWRIAASTLGGAKRRLVPAGGGVR